MPILKSWLKTAVLMMLVVASSIVSSGCARVMVERVSSAPDYAGKDKITNYTQGVKYCRPKPYILASYATDKDGKKTEDLQLKIVYLPDRTDEYAVYVKPGLGSAEFNISLTDGWNLASINEKSDSQLDELITAIGGVVKSVREKAEGAIAKQGAITEPGLYEIQYNDKGHITGVQSVIQF